MSTEPSDTLAEHVRALEREEHFSGAFRATCGDEVILEWCHGFANRADRIPVRPTTRFATASLSKMFTAVGVLDAVGRNELGLDDAVVDLLGSDKRPSTLRDDVTVHHLLSHTSGVADYFEEDEELPGYCDDYASLWHGYPLHELRDYESLLPLFGDLPPVCAPGDTYHYSNAGYVLLGVILAEVSGMPFADAMVARVFEPAAMTSSGYPAVDEVHADIAQNYLPPMVAGGPWRTNIFAVPPIGGGDGGAVVTAEDVERFLRAVQHGGVWHLEPADVLTPRARSWENWHVGYGVDLRPDGVWGKDGGDPGVLVISRYRPSTDTTAVFLANVDDDAVDDLETLAYNLVNSALDSALDTAPDT
jgi:CubicO group peptidase (beta-lactamase class C family)